MPERICRRQGEPLAMVLKMRHVLSPRHACIVCPPPPLQQDIVQCDERLMIAIFDVHHSPNNGLVWHEWYGQIDVTCIDPDGTMHAMNSGLRTSAPDPPADSTD